MREKETLAKLLIMMPVYNDWDALARVIDSIHKELGEGKFNGDVEIVVINDGSLCRNQPVKEGRPCSIEVINLNRNLGHQKAISIGLSYLFHKKSFDAVVVMDADGEDSPKDIIRMIQAYNEDSESIIFAKRGSRTENTMFKVLYNLYKILFVILTEKELSFGNFCIIPRRVLGRLVYVSEIWNHFSGGVIKSNLPYRTIIVDKGKRIAGKSKMDITKFIIHGLSSISVHIDTVAVRLLIFTLTIMLTSLAGITIIFCIKLFTTLAIPGWASISIIGLFLICIVTIFICLFLSFIVLFYRMLPLFIPGIHYNDYIHSIEVHDG